MKKIIGGIVATIVTLVFAISYQVSGASAGHDDDQATTPTSETSTPAPPTTAPPADDSEAKPGDTERDGFTEDHSGKPGEAPKG